MPPVAFTTPLPLAPSRPGLHRSSRLALCRSAFPVRVSTRMRAGPADAAPGPDSVPLGGARDDPLANEDEGEMPPFVGGRNDAVRPAEFEDADDADSRKMAGTVGAQDDLLEGEREGEIIDLQGIGNKVAEEAGQTKDAVVEKAVDAGKAVRDDLAKAKEAVVEKAVDAGKAVAGEATKAKETVASKDVAEPAKKVGKSAVKMTPEQIEKAKAARAAAAKAADEKAAKQMANAKEVLAKAEGLLVKVGSKTGAFALGEKARAKAEVFVEDTIKLSDNDKATQTDKVKASAAGAAKSVVATVTKGWEEKVVPQVKEKLPQEYSGVTNKAFAAAAVGFFVAIALLPSLFSGGGQPAKDKPAKKKLDAETAVLEKKLNRDRNLPSSYSSSRSAAQRSMFPPEERILSPPKAPETPKSVAPLAKVPEVKRSESITDSTKAASPTTSAVTPSKSVESTPQPVTPPKPQPQAEPMKRADVTPAIVMSSVTKALGSNAGLVSSASFDSLSAEPTVVLEVSKAYHRLPAVEQRQIASKTLKATRMLGYERVSFVEKDTGMEVAHAGVDIDLEDETENLRAGLSALRKQSDRLAAVTTNQEAQIDTMKSRLDEERDEFAANRVELERKIKSMQQENTGLIDDLAEAKEEIAKMPDRLALEDRTLEAEKKSEKLTDTVEMLSKQLTVARGDEARAKQVESESLAAVKEADRIKSDALSSVAGQIEQAKADANRKATQDIAEARNEAESVVEASNKRMQEAEGSMAATQKESARLLEDTTRSYEQRLADEEKARTTEVKTIQSKYEAMLEDIQRKAKADLDAFQKEADRQTAAAMKEAKATANSLMKERDQALTETEKSEGRAEKAAMKAAKERDSLKMKIEKLETKLKSKAVSQSEPAAEVRQEVGASN